MTHELFGLMSGQQGDLGCRLSVCVWYQQSQLKITTRSSWSVRVFFFFQAEDGIRDGTVTGVQTCALPISGGVYVYVREGFGRLPAFLFGWTELVLIRASALGAIATPFAEYLLRSLGYNPALEPYATTVHWVAAAAIAVTATLNYIGVNWSSLLLNLTTGAKYGALVLLVVLGFAVGQGEFAHFGQAAGAPHAGLFGLALVSVLWAYDGWGG